MQCRRTNKETYHTSKTSEEPKALNKHGLSCSHCPIFRDPSLFLHHGNWHLPSGNLAWHWKISHGIVWKLYWFKIKIVKFLFNMFYLFNQFNRWILYKNPPYVVGSIPSNSITPRHKRHACATHIHAFGVFDPSLASPSVLKNRTPNVSQWLVTSCN